MLLQEYWPLLLLQHATYALTLRTFAHAVCTDWCAVPGLSVELTHLIQVFVQNCLFTETVLDLSYTCRTLFLCPVLIFI